MSVKTLLLSSRLCLQTSLCTEENKNVRSRVYLTYGSSSSDLLTKAFTTSTHPCTILYILFLSHSVYFIYSFILWLVLVYKRSCWSSDLPKLRWKWRCDCHEWFLVRCFSKKILNNTDDKENSQLVEMSPSWLLSSLCTHWALVHSFDETLYEVLRCCIFHHMPQPLV